MIAAVLQPETFNSGGLARVDISADGSIQPFPAGADPKTWTGQWTIVTNPEDIAKHICSANARQYNQAHDMTLPLPLNP